MFLKIETSFYEVKQTQSPYTPYKLVKKDNAVSSTWQWPPPQPTDNIIHLQRVRSAPKHLTGYYKGTPIYFVEDAPNNLRRLSL